MVTLLKQGPVPLALFICRTGGQTPCVIANKKRAASKDSPRQFLL